MSFLPDKYEIPDSSTGYMKFKQGENKFRILSSAIVGWETWTEEDGKRKPLRRKMDNPFSTDVVDDPTQIKHFWAFVVWNYNEEKVQILEITQKGIMRTIRGLTQDEDWGDPKTYDLVVTREGEGLETQYDVKPKPKKKLDEGIKQFYKDLTINLDALYDGKDPFNTEKEIDIDDIPDLEGQ